MNTQPLVSLITPVLNGRDTIETTISSILNQSYKHIEYIIVDNGSTDGTLDLLGKYKDKITKILSEMKKGIYTTMNKGLKSASGQIIGILNSDDFYANNDVVRMVVAIMEETKADLCWGDLLYVDRLDTNKVIRYWKSAEFRSGCLKQGWMPPHPTLFVRKWVYEKYGYFNTDFKISSDYELMLRFLYKSDIPSCYIPQILVKMRTGGLSNKNIIAKMCEDYKICRLYNQNYFALFMKNMIKIPQFVLPYQEDEQ